jgi:hypothetical protein
MKTIKHSLPGGVTKPANEIKSIATKGRISKDLYHFSTLPGIR